MLAKTENRVFERIDAELSVRYSPQGADREFYSTTRNISGGGIRIPLLRKLDPGTLVDMEIFRPNTDDSIRCRGKVVWAWGVPMDKKQGELFESGIKFINPNLLHISTLLESMKPGTAPAE